ncbi:MAG: NACHT domain-containing protein [bacterium]
MSSRVNARSVRETLETHLASDARILTDSATVFGFAAAAASGEPLSLAAGVALISKTAGAVLSAALEICKRFFDKTDKTPEDHLPQFDRFRVLFYITTLRCYIEAIPDALNSLEMPEEPNGKKKKKPERERIQQLTNELQTQVASLDEAEVQYLLCADPLGENVPLFDTLGETLLKTLAFHGIEGYEVRSAIANCAKEARQRFNTYVSTDEPQAVWLRNFLAISRDEQTARQIQENLESVRQSLENWTHPETAIKEKEKEAWAEYRRDLRLLPDHKETMYNESFGVRKVFLQPQATYHIAGVTTNADQHKVVPDIGRLFGALVSSRVSGEDLIILCGGPGCGKSTLCRVLASTLAEDERIHPVFFRLRRLREGSDVASFLEDSLHRLGVINRLSDLRSVSNLVLILDGFDELVMASRSRLRQFFNMLRDEHSAGPLRNAKIVVSGRDTLFPNGEGLPTGSHVISLLPFDQSRVAAWAKKWRVLHDSGPGRTFKPDALLDQNGKKSTTSPLHHLVTWPLTLHLVARVHTAGRLNLGGKSSQEVEKAYLYRSILAETATRQTEQTTGEGRLDPAKMRDFLRSLAWEMYSRSTDSMDPPDVMPILSKFYPDASEVDMSELADVAVVNCPELAKGEETGFEFVHKSFAEYLVAERMALTIERVVFKAPEFGTDEKTWRMTEDEAAAELAPVIGPRLITEEVQEMLEPMLGCLEPFLKGERVDQIVTGIVRKGGLSRIIDRFEDLLKELLQGKSLEIVNRETQNSTLINSPLEAYAHQCACYLIIGTAAARQLASSEPGKHRSERQFCAAPFNGAFWQCLCLLHAGGLNIDHKLAIRIMRGLTVHKEGVDDLDDRSNPIRLAQLTKISGYNPILQKALSDFARWMSFNQLRTNLLFLFLSATSGRYRSPKDTDLEHGRVWERAFQTHSPFGNLIEAMHVCGLVDESELRPRDVERPLWHEIEHSLAQGRDPMEIAGYALRNMMKSPHSREEEYTARFLAELFHDGFRGGHIDPSFRERFVELIGRFF